MNTFVTGANRGIGLELTRQLLARGDAVVAGARTTSVHLEQLQRDAGPRLRIVSLDVADPASVASAAAGLGAQPLELLINNAGVWGGEHQDVDDLDFEDAIDTYEVNALGPLRLAIAVLPNLRRAHGAKIVSVTSGMGSIADNGSGGSYGYRMSKAALNMAAKGLAVDLRRDGIISVVINPGWVKTDMGGAGATIDAATSVSGMLREIDALTLEDTGTFRNWRGGEYPW